MLSYLEDERQRQEQAQSEFDVYAPLNLIKVSMSKIDFCPYLLNYVFVRSTFSHLVDIKCNREEFEPLRFVTHPVYDEKYRVHSEVLYISDKKMEDYKRVTAEDNKKVIFLRNTRFANKPSSMVQIIEGPFTGLIGRVKRIQSMRCVVLPIGNIQAPAIVDVPNSKLRYLTEEEVAKLGGG